LKNKIKSRGLVKLNFVFLGTLISRHCPLMGLEVKMTETPIVYKPVIRIEEIERTMRQIPRGPGR